MTRQERTNVAKKISLSFVLAAVLAVVLAGTALAAVIGVPESLQEWFGKQWTEAGGGEEMPKAQSEIIESLVQPVGVTCINKGITVTLDSVTPGEGGLWLLYKVKGETLEDEAVDSWQFQGPDLRGRLMEKETVDDSTGATIHSARWQEVGVTEDGTHVFLLFYDAPKGVDFLEGGDLELRLSNITMLGKGDGEEEGPLPVVGEIEAKWILPFTLAPTENVEALTVKSARVPCTKYEWGDDDSGETATTEITIAVQDIRVTTIGYSYLLPEEILGFHENCSYYRACPVLHLAGGITVEGLDSGRTLDDKGVTGSWNLPVDLSEVEAISFDKVTIPLKPSKK